MEIGRVSMYLFSTSKILSLLTILSTLSFPTQVSYREAARKACSEGKS
jgi:hypothetical protein